MNSVALLRGDQVDRVPASLNDRLVWLRRFGKPKIGVYSTGDWHAHIDMNTNTTGASFEVKSDFNLLTPEAAVDQLIARMLVALGKLSGGEA